MEITQDTHQRNESVMEITEEHPESEYETNKLLFDLCMEGKWDRVVLQYKSNKQAHTTRITRTGDTALHVAVTAGREDIVKQLVKAITSLDDGRVGLGVKNERNNTALHFAASMGSVEMCECIASADASLLSVRNVDGETPLFLAALHGRKKHFLSLHRMHIPDNNPYSNCRRNDGDTILHSAIAGDYFDLAFQIINLYKDLVNYVNERGFTPLHLLASKPSVFRSGSRLGRFENLLYHGIHVNELELELNTQQPPPKEKWKCSYPENYETCMNLLWVTKKSASVATNKFPVTRFLIELFTGRKKTRNDVEASQQTAANGIEKKLRGSKSPPLFPDNYVSCVGFIKFLYMALLVILGKGSSRIQKLRRKKQKHVWSVQIMKELLKRDSTYENIDSSGSNPHLKDEPLETAPYSFDKDDGVSLASIKEGQKPSTTEGPTDDKHKKADKHVNQNTPLLIAAKNGVTEMVDEILKRFPVAIHDMDAKKKNILLLAVENRQSQLYELLLKKSKIVRESLFRKVDDEGNSALHLAARLGDYKPWQIPGEALQMHWEIKWYYYIKESMPSDFFGRHNMEYKIPKEIFSETHGKLMEKGGEWLNKTSESCSLVAALIATVAFATSTTVPGGVQDNTGIPTLENRPAFDVFAISSLIALCSSVTSLALFLSILTSRYQEQDFHRDLPRKMIFGLTSLFMSITSMMVSFCAGHFFVLKDKLKNAALPLYAVISLPVTLFALAQFPLYFDLIRATFSKVPDRSYKASLR